MKINKFLSFFFLIITLFSCDCMQRVSGIVIDYETKSPIENVNISRETDFSSKLEKTNENGYFEYYCISGGIFNCPDLELFSSY